jgi:Fe-S oxidoreductase
MFGWFRKKKRLDPIPVEHLAKAIEYQQVAGLLCMDIDILVDVCDSDMPVEDILWQIRDLRDKKDEMIRDKVARESRYAAAAMLFAVSSR